MIETWNLKVTDYIKKVGTVLSKQHFTIPTGIYTWNRLQNGIHEIVGNTSSGRTTFCLNIAKACIDAGILPLYADMNNKLNIEHVIANSIRPELLPIINLTGLDDIVDIVTDNVVKVIIIDEITVVENKIGLLLEQLLRATTLAPDITIIIVNQLRVDIATQKKVPSRKGLIYPYIKSRIYLSRIEKRMGGTLTRVTVNNFSTKARKRFSILVKNGCIPMAENCTLYAIKIGAARYINRTIVAKISHNKSVEYAYPTCIKKEEYINDLLTAIAFVKEEEKREKQSLIEINNKRIATSGIRIKSIIPNSENIHPSRLIEKKQLTN